MTCCRLNLSGLQENKLMNMQQEWAYNQHYLTKKVFKAVTRLK